MKYEVIFCDVCGAKIDSWSYTRIEDYTVCKGCTKKVIDYLRPMIKNPPKIKIEQEIETKREIILH